MRRCSLTPAQHVPSPPRPPRPFLLSASALRTLSSEFNTSFSSSVGLGAIASQLADLRLGELLDTPPPGIDEAIAISKVSEWIKLRITMLFVVCCMHVPRRTGIPPTSAPSSSSRITVPQVIQLLRDPQFSKFEHVVFDTAPTGQLPPPMTAGCHQRHWQQLELALCWCRPHALAAPRLVGHSVRPLPRYPLHVLTCRPHSAPAGPARLPRHLGGQDSGAAAEAGQRRLVHHQQGKAGGHALRGVGRWRMCGHRWSGAQAPACCCATCARHLSLTSSPAVLCSMQVASFVTGQAEEQGPSSLDTFKENLAEVQVR